MGLTDTSYNDLMERFRIVNELILEISSLGRKFFQYKGKVAELYFNMVDQKIYYKCEWTASHDKCITEIALTDTEGGKPNGWYHGGTLLALIRDFQEYIETGIPNNGANGHGGLFCPHWGYSEADMVKVRSKAMSLGYLK